MTKKINKKGFTLAELLVVVAIIAVLVAVSIPIFNAQLDKARLATNQANARAAKAEAVATYLTAADTDKVSGVLYTSYDVSKGTSTTLKAAPTDGGAITGTAIESWAVDTAVGSGDSASTLGKKTFTVWYVAVDADGQATYSAK